MTSIRLEGIRKTFPGVKALQDVTLTIEEGEFFTLLGPSGCGKTTLLRTIAGFYVQDAGTIHLGGQRIDGVPPYRRDTAMVFQNYAVFPHMTVFENVAFGLRNRHVKQDQVRARVEKALRLARLSGYEKRTPDQLSGGQQQRVGLARAVVIEPRVLLMDEPLSNLDAKLRVEMRSEIRSMQKDLGITTVYVTHDQEEALVVSDRIAVMQGGVIQQVGKPWEIYKNPVNAFVASFVGQMNFLDAEASPGGDGAEVAVGGHRFRLPRPFQAAGKGRIAFRPEELFLRPEGSASMADCAALSGVLRSSTFTGSMVSYAVECDGGFPVVVERHKPAPADILPAGVRATVYVPYASILLFDSGTGVRV